MNKLIDSTKLKWYIEDDSNEFHHCESVSIFKDKKVITLEFDINKLNRNDNTEIMYCISIEQDDETIFHWQIDEQIKLNYKKTTQSKFLQLIRENLVIEANNYLRNNKLVTNK